MFVRVSSVTELIPVCRAFVTSTLNLGPGTLTHGDARQWGRGHGSERRL